MGNKQGGIDFISVTAECIYDRQKKLVDAFGITGNIVAVGVDLYAWSHTLLIFLYVYSTNPIQTKKIVEDVRKSTQNT